jgi:hypothetical protein
MTDALRRELPRMLARMEEEVLYPAAILVGDIIRVRMAQK